MKNSILPEKAYRLINPGCLVLLSTARGGRCNVMPLAWHMPVSGKPPLLAVAVAQKHLTADYIQDSREFVLNIPGLKLLPQVQICGSVSGRKEDKFAASGLTPVQAMEVNAPLIGECLAHLECKLCNTWETGDHYVFIGEVVAASADPENFDQMWLYNGDKSDFPVHHLGGVNYLLPGLLVEVQKEGNGGRPLVFEKTLV